MKIQSKKILGLFAFLSIWGCQKSVDLPKGTIPMEKMSLILADLQLAEADVSRLSVSSYDSSKVVYQYLQAKVLKKYNVDSSTYRISYDVYSRYPEYMEKMYTNVLEILEAKSDSLRKRLKNNRPMQIH